MKNTRTIEQKLVRRARVGVLTLLEVGAHHLLFKAETTLVRHPRISSADLVSLVHMLEDEHVETIEGRLLVEVVSDTAIRLRYQEGIELLPHETPMVVGTLPRPTRCDITLPAAGDAAQSYTIRTAERTLTLTTECDAFSKLPHLRINIYDLDGRKLCGIGGIEKDYFGNWDSFNTGICRTNETGAPVATECFDLAPTEAIYGLGEKFVKLNKVGQSIDLDMVDGLGVLTPRSYKNVPFHVSTGGYGVFFNHSSVMTYYVGSISAANVQVAIDDDFLDYYVFTGTIKEVLDQYTTLTGKPALPPKWTFGYWQSKISYVSAEETLEIARQLRAHHIPCDVIHLDTDWYKENWYCDLQFAADRFPDPKAYFAELAAMGFKVSLWQLPYIPEGSQLFTDIKAVDGFVKNEAGDIYDCGMCFTPGFKGTVGVIDFTNPAGVKVYQDALARLFRLGAKIIKTDFGEDAPKDGIYHNDDTGQHQHNLYPLLYNDAVYDVTQRETGDGVVWARSAWAGCQRYPIHWGGDNSPNYENMIPQVTGGLSFGLSGFPFWSQDIGGFLGDTSDALLVRWFPMSMFLSHSRIHGAGDRELYKFSPETQAICIQYLNLRYQLMPYIYGSALACVQDSLPMARALVIDYQDDPTTYDLHDQWLFGRDLLVAPLYSEALTRKVYLPEGMWTNWWTQERFPGKQWITVAATPEQLPLFIREGAIIPLGPMMQYVDEKPVEEITLVVGLYNENGESCFTFPVNTGLATVCYRAEGGRHRVTVTGCQARVTVRPLGVGEVELQGVDNDLS